LHVQPSHVSIRDVWLFVCAKHGNRRVGFGWQDVDECIGVAMECDGGGGFEEFTVEGAEDADYVVGTG
jgi:hypothetical protein